MVKVDRFANLSLYIIFNSEETKQNYGRTFSKVCYLYTYTHTHTHTYTHTHTKTEALTYSALLILGLK